MDLSDIPDKDPTKDPPPTARQLWPSPEGESKKGPKGLVTRLANLGLDGKRRHVLTMATAKYEKAGFDHEAALRWAWVYVQSVFKPEPGLKKERSISPGAEGFHDAKNQMEEDAFFEGLSDEAAFNLREDAIWAYQNKARGNAINMKTCPGSGALSMLSWARKKEDAFMAFLAKVAPSETDGKNDVYGPTDQCDTLLRQIADRRGRELALEEDGTDGGSGRQGTPAAPVDGVRQ